MNNLEISNNTFESIKHVDENGMEFWYARELQTVLNYTQWRRFNEVITKAKEACKLSNNNIFDHFASVGNMSSEELADNLFRIVQTESKLKKDNIKGEVAANQTHYRIGKIVRRAIMEAGGTMPEDLPTPEKSLKVLEKENKKKLTNKNIVSKC